MQTISQFIGTKYTTNLGTSEVQLFNGTTAGNAVRRSGVLVVNSHASNIIYVDDATGVSATQWRYRIGPGETFTVPFGKNISFFAVASGASTTWSAQQVIVADRVN